MRGFLKGFAVFAAFIFAVGSMPAGAVNVAVDGAGVPNAELVNSTTYVPLRAFVNLLDNADVSWNQSTATASVGAPGLHLQVKNGQKYLIANDRALYMHQPMRVVNGTSMVSIRPLAQAFGATVTWDAATYTAAVKKGGKKIEIGASHYNSNDLHWLARIIHAESVGEPLEGQIAVGNVVLNRVASPDFPNTVYDVIFDRTHGIQFSPVADGTIQNTPSELSIIAAKISLEGVQLVPGVLYFQNPALATSQWITLNRKYHSTIGNHQFYT
jgi:N-acetylmuramoyl-L-alanine amidase